MKLETGVAVPRCRSPGCRRTLHTLGLALLLCMLTPEVRAGVLEGPVVNPANGHSYYLLDNSNWTDAEAQAVALGGHLATINDQAENDWLLNLWGSGRNLWLGLNDVAVEGTFVWVSGEASSYRNWHSGEPNGGAGSPYVYMYATGFGGMAGQWNDCPNVTSEGVPLHGVVELVDLTPPKRLLVWAGSPNPVAPYASWATAAHTIQTAVDAAENGDIVLVTNGVYTTGGGMFSGTLPSRVAIYKAILVESVNGPEVTRIVGAEALGGGNGDGAIRCAYVGTNALLSGFTLTNGHTRTSGDAGTDQSGGGVWCEGTGMVTNCVITRNLAAQNGEELMGVPYTTARAAPIQHRMAAGCMGLQFTIVLSAPIRPLMEAAERHKAPFTAPPLPVIGSTERMGGGVAARIGAHCLTAR